LRSHRIESRLCSNAAGRLSPSVICIPSVGQAALRLLIKLLQPVLELGQVVDLTLEHLDGVVLLHAAAHLATSLLQLAHLVHSTDDFLLWGRHAILHLHLMLQLLLLLLLVVVVGFHLLHLLLRLASAIFLLVHDLDSGDVCAVTGVVLELHVVVEQEVHEAPLLVLGQLAEDKRLRLRLFLEAIVGHLTLGKWRPATGLLTTAVGLGLLQVVLSVTVGAGGL
jgi:hypothetical protein